MPGRWWLENADRRKYSYAIDDKGKLGLLPNSASHGRHFHRHRWLDDCLVAFPEDEWERNL